VSWQSTAIYYSAINTEIAARRGKHHSARIILSSIDFEELLELWDAERWDDVKALLCAAARTIERAGADCLLLCANSIHKYSDAVESAVRIPLLHIVDSAAKHLRSRRVTTVGLLGTRYTMEGEFFRQRLERHGIRAVVPEAAARQRLHQIIFDELVLGTVRERSQLDCAAMMRDLVANGAQAILLGCTELPLLVTGDGFDVPVLDTAAMHALDAVDFALRGAGEVNP
jgi:aspartate racemase